MFGYSDVIPELVGQLFMSCLLVLVPSRLTDERQCWQDRCM